MLLIERFLATYANGWVRHEHWLLPTLLTLYLGVTWSIWSRSRAIIYITRSVAKYLEMINCFLWICKYSASLGSHVSFLQCTAEWILYPFSSCGKKINSEENINGIEKGWQMDFIICTEGEIALCLKICGFLFFSQFLSKLKTIGAIVNLFFFHVFIQWSCIHVEGKARRDYLLWKWWTIPIMQFGLCHVLEHT